jgi:hypothetical protein
MPCFTCSALPTRYRHHRRQCRRPLSRHQRGFFARAPPDSITRSLRRSIVLYDKTDGYAHTVVIMRHSCHPRRQTLKDFADGQPPLALALGPSTGRVASPYLSTHRDCCSLAAGGTQRSQGVAQ